MIPTTIEIVDIAGLVKGASKGEGLGNKFLGNIRNTNAIIHVLRCFDNGNITHVDGSIDPVRDKEIIDTELQLTDLETVENRLSKTQKAATSGGDKQAKRAVELLQHGLVLQEQGRSARTVELEKEDRKLVADLNLLTDKPVLYYPLDSWFIRSTAAKERMIELNRTIRWKPESTGTGRFGKPLINLVGIG